MESFISKHRFPLINTLSALSKGKLTVGYIGGSITDARAGHNWPEPVTAWFVERFPQVQIVEENAAIGATGSDLAVFRAQRDLIDRGCDLVFVEFAANDISIDPVRRMRSREGLFRKLLADGCCDIVATYTFIHNMYEEMYENKVPRTIEDFEILCEHYGAGSVWMSRYALDEVLKGRMRWDQWLPDGLHPTERGSLSYAQSVIAFLERELLGGEARPVERPELPPPLDPLCWERTEFIPFEAMRKTGPWAVKRSVGNTWMNSILSTSAPGARLSFEFEGRYLLIGFDFGKKSSEIRWRIDGGEWQVSHCDRSAWVPDSTWFFLRELAADLPSGRHRAEMESIHGGFEGCNGTRCEIAFVGVVK